LQNPTHEYTAAGSYTVTLTATNDCGSDAETKVDHITVTTPPAAECDDFQDRDISDWAEHGGTWTAKRRMLRGDSDTVDACIISPFGSHSSATIDAAVRMNRGEAQRKARIIFAYQDPANYRFVEGNDLNDIWSIYERKGEINSLVSSAELNIRTGKWQQVTVHLESDGTVNVDVNGTSSVVSHKFPSVVAGLVGCGYNRSNSDFDDFCLTPGP
jgi:PKD repeat protein